MFAYSPADLQTDDPADRQRIMKVFKPVDADLQHGRCTATTV